MKLVIPGIAFALVSIMAAPTFATSPISQSQTFSSGNVHELRSGNDQNATPIPGGFGATIDGGGFGVIPEYMASMSYNTATQRTSLTQNIQFGDKELLISVANINLSATNLTADTIELFVDFNGIYHGDTFGVGQYSRPSLSMQFNDGPALYYTSTDGSGNFGLDPADCSAGAHNFEFTCDALLSMSFDLGALAPGASFARTFQMSIQTKADPQGEHGTAFHNLSATLALRGVEQGSTPPVTPVPEPSVWAVLCAGFSGLGLLMRRRRALNALPGV
jgi:hypothetical protein